MKKRIGLVFIVIVALVLASYYSLGYLTERTLKRDFALINKTSTITVDLKTYQRSLFTSNAMLHLSAHIPERKITDSTGQTTILAAEEYDLDVPLTVFHGPIIFAKSTVKFGFGYAVTNISIPTNLTEKFNNLMTSDSDKPELHIALFVNYLNKTYIDTNVPKFKITYKDDKTQLEWLGLNGEIKLSPNLSDVIGNINFGGINLIKQQNQINLGEITSDYDLHQHPIGLYVGTANIDLHSLQILAANTKVVQLDDFQIKSGSDINNDLFNSYTNFYLKKFINGDREYGPGYFDVSVKNIDAKALTDLNQKLNQIQQNNTAKQQALFIIVPELPKLVGHGAEFEIKRLELVMPEGKLEGNLQLNVSGSNINSPFQLVQSLQGNAHLKVPVEIVNNLVAASVRQNLKASASLHQAMVDQLQKSKTQAQTLTLPANSKPNSSDTNSAKPVSDSTDVNKAEAGTPDNSPPASEAQIEQMTVTQTNQKLQAMQASGLLVLQDNYYIIDIILKDGQFSINKKPFNSAMMQF